MNRLLFVCATAASLCFAIATPVQAAGSTAGATSKLAPHITNMTREQLLAYHTKLEHDLGTKSYNHIKDRDREEIAKSQTQIRSMLDTVKSLDDLNETQRLALFNEHEKITALLESREKDRLICERVTKTGTHRPVVECVTVADRELERQGAQKSMQDADRQANPRPSN